MNWHIYEFGGDPSEREGIRLTCEILKTVAVLIFCAFVVGLVS